MLNSTLSIVIETIQSLVIIVSTDSFLCAPYFFTKSMPTNFLSISNEIQSSICFSLHQLISEHSLFLDDIFDYRSFLIYNQVQLSLSSHFEIKFYANSFQYPITFRLRKWLSVIDTKLFFILNDFFPFFTLKACMNFNINRLIEEKLSIYGLSSNVFNPLLTDSARYISY